MWCLACEFDLAAAQTTQSKREEEGISHSTCILRSYSFSAVFSALFFNRGLIK